MNVKDIRQALSKALTEARYFNNNDVLSSGEQDFLNERNNDNISTLLQVSNKLDFDDALATIADEMNGEDVVEIVNYIVENEYRTHIIHQKLGTSSRKQSVVFNSATLEALTYENFLSPLHSINYCVCFGQISPLPTLLYNYPEEAIEAFAFDTLKFKPSIAPSFTKVFMKYPERYPDLFSLLLSPKSMFPEIYAHLLKTCLTIDQEETLLLLTRLHDTPSEYMTVIASQIIDGSSIPDLLRKTPEHHKPFILKLISSGL